MRFLLTDFISPQRTRGLASDLKKINHNLALVPGLADNVTKQKEHREDAFSAMTVFGRWIVIYQANVRDDEDTLMHFIDFRVDFGPENTEVFSAKTIQNINELQTRYDVVFDSKYDTVELSFAQPYESVIQPDFFGCDQNEIVMAKARTIGALPVIETLPDNAGIKVVLADERLDVDGEEIVHVYALMHFGGEDNGLAYLKIHDLLHNLHLIPEMQKAIEEAGGQFDRSYLIERFGIAKLN